MFDSVSVSSLCQMMLCYSVQHLCLWSGFCLSESVASISISSTPTFLVCVSAFPPLHLLPSPSLTLLLDSVAWRLCIVSCCWHDCLCFDGSCVMLFAGLLHASSGCCWWAMICSSAGSPWQGPLAFFSVDPLSSMLFTGWWSTPFSSADSLWWRFCSAAMLLIVCVVDVVSHPLSLNSDSVSLSPGPDSLHRCCRCCFHCCMIQPHI